MKKFLCLLTTMLLVLTSASSAFANPLFDKHWNQGECWPQHSSALLGFGIKQNVSRLAHMRGISPSACMAGFVWKKDYKKTV